MNPKEVPASEVLKVLVGLGNPTKSELMTALESQGLLNDGVKSLIKGSKDLTGDLGKMGDNPIEKTYHHMSDFFSPKNSEFFTEKMLPGVIGTMGSLEMMGHPDEMFGGETYKNLYQELESKPYEKKPGMSHFMDDIQESSNPYGRTKWSRVKRNKTASVDQVMENLLPSGLTAQNVMAKFQGPAFQALSPNQKVAYVDQTLRNLTKDLAPLMNYLKQMGFNVYNES